MNNSESTLCVVNRVGRLSAKTFYLRLSVFLVFCVFLTQSQVSFSQLPIDPSVIHGSATVDITGNHMSITNSPDAIINWQDFSIGNGSSVHFHQQDASSQILNRITGNNASEILGNLSSNGGVWLINPHGILFGENARIDVGSLITSTLDITNLDFLAHNYQFNAVEGGSGNVMNHGEIRTSLGGRVWMVGGQVHNDGLIQSPQGEIVLAAGHSVEFIDSGTPNIVVRINAPENDVVSIGNMVSTNGQVDVHGSIVNQEGIVRANSVTNDAFGNIVLQSADTLILAEKSLTQADAGKVQLKADEILHEGQITAQAGVVNIQAEGLTHLDGQVNVSSLQGAGGKILLETERFEGMADSALLADGQQGGHIQVIAEDSIAFSSTMTATGVNQGGKIEVSGDSVILLNAEIDVSGGGKGGIVHLGGGWQGEGNLPHADEVIVGVGSEIRANGNDSGGEIVVWSTQNSEHHGSLQAQSGGRVELSSKGEVLQTGNVQVGPGGEVLYDPKNLIITDNPPDNLTLVRKVISGSVNGKPELSSGDNFGSSIALDGDRLAIGASRDDADGSDQGAVHLFTGMDTNNLNGLTWQKKLTSGHGAIGMSRLNDFDFFGIAVALDGDHLAVGARGEFLGEINQGAVHLFSGVGTDFAGLTKRSEIVSETTAALDFFGTALALDGDRLVVGASGDSTAGGNRGAVFLYTGIETNIGNPSRVGKIFSGNGAIGMPELADTDFFGWAVALDGSRLAVGALGDSSTGNDRGAVHLFSNAGTNFSGLTWEKKLESNAGAHAMPVLADTDFFGWSVALDGNRLAVGAFGDSTNGNNSGAVHLFTSVGDNFSELAWVNKLVSGAGSINMPLLADGDGFGWSLAMDGDNLAVGALRDNGGDSAVYLFKGVENKLSGVSFADNAAGNSYITPNNLISLLNAGSSVTLQANNDITVLSPVTVDASDIDGASGSLTLQSGRDILLEANITTGNADLVAVAGDPGANRDFREPGVPKLVIADDVSLDVGSAIAILATVDGDFINNNKDQAVLTDAGGRWLIYAASPETSTEGFTTVASNRAFNQPFVPGTIPEQATNGNWFFYSAEEPGSPFSPPGVGVATIDALVQNLSTGMAGAKVITDAAAQRKTIDLTMPQSFDLSFDLALQYFSTLDLSRMSFEEMRLLMAYRHEYKDKIFADAIHKLELDPSLADVPICSDVNEIDSGLCRITELQRDEYKSKVIQDLHAGRKVSIRNIPQIERKYIVLFGINQYTDEVIPPLESAVFDAQVVGSTFADRLGYETQVIKNATRTELVRTLNRLSVEMQAHDSVVIYYAGHGLMLEKTGHGYWIPSDASASEPESWISNKSISDMLAVIDSKQIAVISDSCYSGAFASESKLDSAISTKNLDEILNLKGVVAMTAGSDEPVSDEGRGGHSIFAWYLIQAIQKVNTWNTGVSLFKEIQEKVSQSFPQTPQYGGIVSAGYETGGDYLFEFRQLEEAQ